MVALAERPCTPCRGGVSPLTPSECASYLVEVPDWELRNEGRTIARRFRFPDYRTALAFTNAVSALAEETSHHPERWSFCEVSLTTRKIGGLHESDFVMAARIDALARSSRFRLAVTSARTQMGSRKSKGVESLTCAASGS
jgi:4a-hydroxytetrahydrobiopterin dehydratase